MKTSGAMTLVSFAIVLGVGAYTAIADHHEELPQLYSSLDKSKSWNQLASELDPRMSDGQYDKMRNQYFYDVVAPKVNERSSVSATYEEFMRRTDRPWRWDRHSSEGEPPRTVMAIALAAFAFLVFVISSWTWREILKPVALVARDEGLTGVAKLVLHGRKRTAG